MNSKKLRPLEDLMDLNHHPKAWVEELAEVEEVEEDKFQDSRRCKEEVEND